MSPVDARVQLNQISITGFRNIALAHVEPVPRFNVISGCNGMGKTNLIEAIYMLGALRSFRTTVRRELIGHGGERATIQAVFGSVSAGLKCTIAIGTRDREILCDDKKVSPASHFQSLPMVLFYPQVMELVQGGPEARRRFIDRALFQAHSRYPMWYKNYLRVLANRNHLLRQHNAHPHSLLPFDIQLADLGHQIVSARYAFVASMAPFFEAAVDEIGLGLPATIRYQPRLTGDRDTYLARLHEKLPIDRERKYTTAGPHADDILFLLDGRPARKFASQGQQRTMVLAAKIAETRSLTEKSGRIPLLLFDDVSSELDKQRNARLFDFLSGMGGQVFITTTHPDYIHLEADRRDFVVRDGTVERL